MLNKINKEIETFTSTIKELEGCDKMLIYINSNIYSAIKLLMFASSSFSIIARVLMFLIIFLAGVLVLTAIGAVAFNINYLIVSVFVLFILILVYVMHFKNNLSLSIKNKRISMEENKS